MSRGLNLPLSQQRHSNVATVRLCANHRRLEIACYKNKVLSYRNGVEDRLDEVLQIDRVFVNVSRGEFASLSDIRAVLGPEATEKSALEHILKFGDVQIAQHERHVENDELMKDVCSIVAQKCVHPTSLRPYSTAMIEEAVKVMGVSLRRDIPAKAQALRVIKDLCATQPIPIRRAHMRLSLQIPDSVSASELAEHLDGGAIESVTSESSTQTVLFTTNPEAFRQLDEWSKARNGQLTVIDTAVMDTSEGGVAGIEAMLQCAVGQSDATRSARAEDNNISGNSSTVSAEVAERLSKAADLESRLVAVKDELDEEAPEKAKKKTRAKKTRARQKEKTKSDSEEELVSERKLNRRKKPVEEQEEDESWKDGLDE